MRKSRRTPNRGTLVSVWWKDEELAALERVQKSRHHRYRSDTIRWAVLQQDFEDGKVKR